MELLLAYSMINASSSPELTQEGVEAYWRGLDAVDNEQDANLGLARPEGHRVLRQRRRIRNLPVDQKSAYIRAYWQSLSDQSFVNLDERLAGHYRRLHYVMQNFRLDLPEHAPPRSTPCHWQTGFDDRGVIYLRHGPPDDTANFWGRGRAQSVARNTKADAEPLLFHFVSNEETSRTTSSCAA